LPGGWGTLHELINFLVHQQFGYCRKKIILLDSNQYWTYLIAQFNIMVTAGALSQKHLDQLIVVTSIEGVVENFSSSPADCNGLSDRFWEQVILKL
jgi:predicted Rossmann-fold nucleotide-binding protein